jgi:hypothetical protein
MILLLLNGSFSLDYKIFKNSLLLKDSHRFLFYTCPLSKPLTPQTVSLTLGRNVSCAHLATGFPPQLNFFVDDCAHLVTILFTLLPILLSYFSWTCESKKYVTHSLWTIFTLFIQSSKLFLLELFLLDTLNFS